MNLQALSVLSAETGLEFAMPSQAAARVKELAAKAKLEAQKVRALRAINHLSDSKSSWSRKTLV